jgi:endo-1,4-beta-xylanase
MNTRFGWRLVPRLTGSFLSLFFIVLPITARAQSGVSILPDNLYDQRGDAGANATAEPIGVAGQPFTQGYRITVRGTSARIGDARLAWRTAQPIQPGDNLRVTFWVRKLTPLDGANIRGFVSFEDAARPELKSLLTPFPCDSDVWTRYSIPFKAAAGSAAGEAQFAFQFAHGPQQFELGGIRVESFGPTPPLQTTAASVLPDDVYRSHFAYFDNAVGGAARVIAVEGQPFTQGYQLSHNGDSDFAYRSGLGWRNARAVARGDLLQLAFWARKLEPDDDNIIRAQVVFERASGNFEKSLSTNFPTESSQWRLYRLPFRASANFAPSEAQLVFQFAYGPQRFELGGVSLLNYGQSARPDQLPAAFYYPTRGETAAAWRVAARERIEQIRKGALRVRVHDRDGVPVPGATVYVQQRDHAYRFGSAVTAARLMSGGADNDLYRSRVSSHFTTTVFENDLKWGLWECANCGASFNKAQTRAAVAWLAERGIPVRGHNLIWPSWNYMPADTRTLGPDALRQRIETRFADVMGDAGVNGKLYDWDVVNEPYTNFDVMGRIGGVAGVNQSDGVLPNRELIRWFQLARMLDPGARLFVNDFDILAAGGQDVRHQDYLFTLTRWMLDNGAPVDGVGLQGHFSRVTTPARLLSIIERFARLPVELAVTEFDYNILDEELQADYTRDVMTMIFSQPKFTDFLMWGFWERAHWLPDSAMYRADWSSKPNALVWNDLLFREWWTNETGATGADGSFAMRGFKGDYTVTVAFNRMSQTEPATIRDNGEIIITLNTTLARRPIRRVR